MKGMTARLKAIEARLEKLETLTKTAVPVGFQVLRVEHSGPPGWPRAFIAAVADHFGVSESTLFIRRRTREIVWPRQLAQWALASLGMASPSVDSLFDQSRGTAKHAFRRVEDAVDRVEIGQRADVWRLAVAAKWQNSEPDPVACPATQAITHHDRRNLNLGNVDGVMFLVRPRGRGPPHGQWQAFPASSHDLRLLESAIRHAP